MLPAGMKRLLAFDIVVLKCCSAEFMLVYSVISNVCNWSSIVALKFCQPACL